MKYDIEADWHLLDTCNYSCSYCFFGPEVLKSKLRKYAAPSDWQSAFDVTGNIWLLHMTGGEPSIYSDFAELCEALTARHYISLNSNLTHRSLVAFSQRIDPSRVSFINAGLHLEERENRAGNETFLRHAELLRGEGFPIVVSLVATPTALDRFEEAIALLQPIGLFPVPKLFRGSIGQRAYPKDYSEAQKNRFRAFSQLARDHYGSQLARMSERPSIDMLNDDAFLEGLPTYTGSLCEAGARFVHIKPNGDVFSCAGGPWQGNILSDTFVRQSGLAPCNSSHCYYFCNKYSRLGQSMSANDPRRTLGNDGTPYSMVSMSLPSGTKVL